MTAPANFFAHRDASTPCRELLEWLTDVPIARDGTDAARSQLRAYPRHTYSFDIVSTKDGDKAWLSALRTGETFLLPLWCHAFQRPDTEASAGVAATSPVLVGLTPHGEGVAVPAGAFAWDVDSYIAAPAALGRPVADSRSVTFVTSGIQRTAVAFRLLDFKEEVAAYSGPTSGGLPTLAPFTGYWTNPKEQVDVNANAFDNSHLDLYEARYFKRTFTLDLTLTTRAQILAFRQLMFALKGRLNPVRWAAPGEAESTWRLASDSVDISYHRPGLATCQLSLVQLEA